MDVRKIMGVVGFAAFSAGCGGADEVTSEPYTVMETSEMLSNMTTAGESHIGDVTLTVSDQPRTFHFEAVPTLNNGEARTNVSVLDRSDGSWAHITIDNARSVASIAGSAGNSEMVFLDDGSILVDGSTYSELGTATEALMASPAVAPLSAEMLAAADYALDRVGEAKQELAAKGGFWKKVKKTIKKGVKKALKHGIRIRVPF